MPTAAEVSEVLAAEECAQEHGVGIATLRMKDDVVMKDGADMLRTAGVNTTAGIFGPAKLQELHQHLMQQHDPTHKHDHPVVIPEVLPPASPPPKKREASLAVKGASLAVWFVFNSTTLILNKYLFSVMAFHYPLTLTAIHMATCFFFAYMITRVLKLVPYHPLSRNDVVTKILPLALVFCTNIVFGNFSIRWIPISFMQTVKSSVPAFTVVLQYFLQRKIFSREIYLSLVPVVGGVALASCTEINFVMGGFVCALIGSLLTGIQAVIIHSSAVKLDPINLILYTSPAAFAMLLIPCALFEFDVIREQWPHYNEFLPLLWLLLSGTVAFLLNYSSFIVSSVLSPLTMTVAGNFKAVINIVASVIVFSNPIGPVNWFGCAVATSGVMWYNHLMTKQKKDPK